MADLTRDPPVSLHLGAHRTGTASVWSAFGRADAQLRARGVAIWGPDWIRGGVLHGVLGDPGRLERRNRLLARRTAGRLSLQRRDMAGQGVRRLVLSDAALLGSLRENVLLARLYPSAGVRLRRLAAVLPGVDRIGLTIRAPETFWASAFAHMMRVGFAPPGRDTIHALTSARRGWRDVITDVIAAFPQAALRVAIHDESADDPTDFAAWLTDGPLPAVKALPFVNAAPGIEALHRQLRAEGHDIHLPERAGRYAPFSPDDCAILQDRFEADLAWLRAGADGRIDTQTDVPTRGPSAERRPTDVQPRRQDAMDQTG